ncbi:NAD(+) diphosphatase [Microbacterium elymi]|uniref:NAD(+) diphosphatase n=1 Tax=Microbacterium elymi TaxID=2909587 RepID=UPI00338F94D9
MRGDPSARVLVIRGDRAVLAEDGTRLRYRRVQEVPEDALWAFLGRTAAGVPLLLAARAADAPDPDDGAWAPLRVIGGGLDAADAAALVTAVSLGRWLRDSPFCPSCGARTAVSTGGWARTCPDCGREHFPRTDPAVIVAVGSEDGDRLLLGSNALWDANRFSCFAGFVEAGESAEGAVARELARRGRGPAA